MEDADAGARPLPKQDADALRGHLMACRSELGRLAQSLKTMQRTHTKQMEHLRFLIHNRLNAKPQGPPHAAANEDNAAETPEVVSVPFDLHMRGVRSGVASAAAANASTTDDGEDEQGVAASSAVPAAASTAAVNTSDTAAPYDDDEDLQGQADWKEGIQPIGYLRSCFRRKNGTPRQPNLVPGSVASMKMTYFANSAQALEGLEHYSHVWLVFFFHLNDNVAVKPKIRPPKLPDRRVGVMCTRSPHRPNPIGLSLVKLDRVEGDTLWFSGVDLVDRTPILDIKPYLPWYDMPTTPPTHAPWVEEARGRLLEVQVLPEAQTQIEALVPQLRLYSTAEDFTKTMVDILAVDPRSTYRKDKCRGKDYAFTLDQTDIFCRFEGSTAIVFKVLPFRTKAERNAGHLTELVAEAH